MKTHTIRLADSASAPARVYTEPSKTAAIRFARAAVKGLPKGQGIVCVYEGAPAEAGMSNPIKVFRA